MRPERQPGSALGFVLSLRMLRRTIPVALIVGTILSAINQGHLLAAGDMSVATWARVISNFVVPFVVANIGALTASARP